MRLVSWIIGGSPVCIRFISLTRNSQLLQRFHRDEFRSLYLLLLFNEKVCSLVRRADFCFRKLFIAKLVTHFTLAKIRQTRRSAPRSNSIIRSRLCRFLGIKKEGVNTFSFNGGNDEARTRDLMRDRHAL